MIRVYKFNSIHKSAPNLYTRHVCSKSETLKSDVTNTTKKFEDSHVYCLAHIRKYDRENYLAALCIKDKKFRRAIVALRAFNVELSLVRDSTTNSDRAKIRLNFWAQLIEEIIRRDSDYEMTPDKLTAYYNYTPVAKELLELFSLVDLNEDMKKSLRDLIGARLSSKVLGYKLFDTMKELELYCSKSNTSIYHLGYNMGFQLRNTWYANYGIMPSIEAISQSLGVAHGLSNIIRGIPYNASKNCCYIPKDLLKEYNLTSRDFIGTKLDDEKIRPVIKKLSSRCQELATQAYLDSRYIPNFFRHLFLPRVAIQANLNKLRKCNYNICDPLLGKRDGLLPLNFWMASKVLRAPIL